MLSFFFWWKTFKFVGSSTETLLSQKCSKFKKVTKRSLISKKIFCLPKHEWFGPIFDQNVHILSKWQNNAHIDLFCCFFEVLWYVVCVWNVNELIELDWALFKMDCCSMRWATLPIPGISCQSVVHTLSCYWLQFPSRPLFTLEFNRYLVATKALCLYVIII